MGIIFFKGINYVTERSNKQPHRLYLDKSYSRKKTVGELKQYLKDSGLIISNANIRIYEGSRHFQLDDHIVLGSIKDIEIEYEPLNDIAEDLLALKFKISNILIENEHVKDISINVDRKYSTSRYNELCAYTPPIINIYYVVEVSREGYKEFVDSQNYKKYPVRVDLSKISDLTGTIRIEYEPPHMFTGWALDY